MKRILSIITVVLLLAGLCSCGSSASLTIAVPNDTSNEARALILLENLGYIKLKDGAGINATKLDIAENPHNIEIKEVEAAQLPNVLKDVDFAVINGNYAIEAGLNPISDALGIEGSASPYANILAVKQGNENDPAIKALVAALQSKQVADFISDNYKDGSVVSAVDVLTDGYDSSIDYSSLSGKSISVAASPVPHADILKVCKEILAAKNITLEIKEFTDYIQPNNVVQDGTYDANFFQHVPYLDEFNEQNGTTIVSVCTVHCEPMGLYGGKQKTTDILK